MNEKEANHNEEERYVTHNGLRACEIPRSV